MGAYVLAGAVVLFAVVGLVFGVVLPFIRGADVARPLPKMPRVSVVGEVDDARLASALVEAACGLVAAGVWQGHQVDAVVARGFGVYVRPELTWLNGSGVVVAGETDLVTRVVYVGRDLAALCHEFAHLCEADINFRIDNTHEAWTARGIMRAIDEWQTWLKGSVQ